MYLSVSGQHSKPNGWGLYASFASHLVVSFLHEPYSELVLCLIIVLTADVEIEKEYRQPVKDMPETMRADTAHIIAEYLSDVHLK